MKIKLLFSLLTVVLITSVCAWAYNYDITIPLKGNSLAEEEVQEDSLFTVYSFALRVADPTCQNYAITNTQVSKQKVNGTWEEIWTIKACKKEIDVPIRFTEKDKKTSYFLDPMRTKVRVAK